ncbi:hypothetical protein [Sulfuracidifex metallicus]|nr:hypothetical protein [Sulfuracidifex metallicus]
MWNASPVNRSWVELQYTLRINVFYCASIYFSDGRLLEEECKVLQVIS